MCKEKDLRKRTWSMCVCVHVCVRKRTFHVCVFQEKRITRITLVYQVDVCVLMCVCKECVRKRTKGKGHGLRVCVCSCVRKKKTFHLCVFEDKSITRMTWCIRLMCVLMGVC